MGRLIFRAFQCEMELDYITVSRLSLVPVVSVCESNPFSPVKAPNFAELCNPITRQAIELESYPNHPWIQQVL